MTDPVCAADDLTYELDLGVVIRHVVIGAAKGTSVRGATLESKSLFSNYSLRSMMCSSVEAVAAPPAAAGLEGTPLCLRALYPLRGANLCRQHDLCLSSTRKNTL